MSIKISPDYSEAHYELGVIYQSILKFEEAIIEYKKAKKYITHDMLNYNLGLLLYSNDRPQEALSPLREYIINNPEDYEVLEILGDIFQKENRYSEAIDTVLEYLSKFKDEGLDLREFSPGGGFAIGYVRNQLRTYVLDGGVLWYDFSGTWSNSVSTAS